MPGAIEDPWRRYLHLGRLEIVELMRIRGSGDHHSATNFLAQLGRMDSSINVLVHRFSLYSNIVFLATRRISEMRLRLPTAPSLCLPPKIAIGPTDRDAGGRLADMEATNCDDLLWCRKGIVEAQRLVGCLKPCPRSELNTRSSVL
jgi:hypothetical protein